MGATQTAKFEKAGSIERLDPAIDAILPADAVMEKVEDDGKWTEGPVWVRGGYLLFADIPNNRIMKWTPDDQYRVNRRQYERWPQAADMRDWGNSFRCVRVSHAQTRPPARALARPQEAGDEPPQLKRRD